MGPGAVVTWKGLFTALLFIIIVWGVISAVMWKLIGDFYKKVMDKIFNKIDDIYMDTNYVAKKIADLNEFVKDTVKDEKKDK